MAETEGMPHFMGEVSPVCSLLHDNRWVQVAFEQGDVNGSSGDVASSDRFHATTNLDNVVESKYASRWIVDRLD